MGMYNNIQLQIHPHSEMWDWWNSLGLGWLAILLGIIGWILITGSALYISHFMHKDAIKRNIPYPEIWLLGGLIFNVFGLIVYLINRGNYKFRKDT